MFHLPGLLPLQEGVRDSALLAIDGINEAGGVNGIKLVPVVEDSKADGAETSNVMNKLITGDGWRQLLGR